MAPRGGQPGIGVDYRGGDVVDPTKNVEDLVKALEVALEKLRIADARRLDDLRSADIKRADDLRDADSKRLSELSGQKDRYDRQIFDIQTVQVKTTSDLISAQLSKETASLANQINASTVQNQGLINTLSERIRVLEQARSEVFGRSSASDPAQAEAMARMATSISELNTILIGLKQTESRVGGQKSGASDANSRLLAIVMVFIGIATVVSPIIMALAFRGH